MSKLFFGIIILALKNAVLFKLTWKIIKRVKTMEQNIRQKKANETIVALQADLVPLVNELYEKGEICFRTVPAVGSESGDYWVPGKDIKGRYIHTYFEENPEWVIETSKRVADDYQKVITAYQQRKRGGFQNLLENGKKWIFGKLLMWGGSIVEEGLLDHSEITRLTKEFQDVINEKGEKFFGYFHGNTIGDHIYIGEDKTFYLLGMRIVPRPGDSYYDFLRALDWLFLKASGEEENFKRIVGWMKQYLASYDREEVKLVFALRCIGILGWDMLHRGDFGKGDAEKKKEFLLKFIKREY